MATSSQPPIVVEKLLINCIPEELQHRFDPTFVEYHSKYNAGRLVTHQVPIEDVRKNRSKYAIDYGHELVDNGSLIIAEEKCPVNGGEITIRIFQLGNVTSSEERPAYVNFHGGGWTFGGLATDYDFCKRVVLDLECAAFDVDYRLAPEYKFPIPIDDRRAALN